MLAKSGDSLMDDETKTSSENALTISGCRDSNIPEAEEITGLKIDTEDNIRKAGHIFINEIGSKGVVIKGGHSVDLNNAKDFYLLKMMSILLKISDLIRHILMVQVVHFQLLSQLN